MRYINSIPATHTSSQYVSSVASLRAEGGGRSSEAATGCGSRRKLRQGKATLSPFTHNNRQSKKYKKYRCRGMDLACEELLIRLFEGQVAAGRLAFSPSMDPSLLSQPPPVTLLVVADAHSGADGLGGDDFFSRFMGTINNEPAVVPPTTAPGPSQEPSSQPKEYAPKCRRRQSVRNSMFEEYLVQSRTNNDRLVSLFEEDISSQAPPCSWTL